MLPATSQGSPLHALPVLQPAGLVSFATASVLPGGSWVPSWLSPAGLNREEVAWQSFGSQRKLRARVLQMGPQASGVSTTWSL